MRNYGDKVQIDPDAVRQLFDDRFDANAPLLSVMLSTDKQKLLVRDENEKSLILPKLRLDQSRSRVLDIGCGYGRWFEVLKGRVAHYEGCDVSEPYIELAKATFRAHREAEFRVLSADALSADSMRFAPYTLVISSALFHYLNDDQIEASLRQVLPLMVYKSQIYIRCSVSLMERRLTLKDFPSQEMGANYNAIYRTTEEYQDVFSKILKTEGFDVSSTDLLLDEKTGARAETNQRYWLLERGS